MFGKNQVTKQNLGDGQSLLVHSIFPTIQGEGPHTGKPCVFVRLGGCNLRCRFCDTEFERDVTEMTLQSILEQILEYQEGFPSKLVVITGGEPFLQNFLPLTEALNFLDILVQIETAGTLMVPGIEAFFDGESDNMIVCSPKTVKINKKLIPYIDAYKYIIVYGYTDPEDGLPTLSTQKENEYEKLYRPPGIKKRMRHDIFVQPCDEHSPDGSARNMEEAVRVSMAHGYNLSVQVHKVAGVE